jgi:hypothetical protein
MKSFVTFALLILVGCSEQLPYQPPPQAEIDPPPGIRIMTNGKHFSFARGSWRCIETFKSREEAIANAWSFYRHSEKIRIEDSMHWTECN